MEKRDKRIVFLIAVVAVGLGHFFKLDYSKIAESGLTLSSIVLAVYIAAIIGLINSELAAKMKKEVSVSRPDKTQLGQLTTYFKHAVLCSIGTIVVSSLVLLISEPEEVTAFYTTIYYWISIVGLVLYTENIAFLSMTIRFMLNRQIWDT